MASGSLNMTTYIAKKIIGSNTAQDPGGALLQSGAGRADNSTTGDTWIFLDSIGGTTNYWGFKHDQGNNAIRFYGGGTLRSTIWLGESKITATTFAGNASTATTLETSRKIWGQSFNGSADISGNLSGVGGSLYGGTDVTTLQFLTSGGGALNGKFGRIGLNSTYANADLTNYVLHVTGASYINGLLTIAGTNATHKGVKIGDTYINAINGSLILQNNSAIRFGTDDWDWNKWAGLKYDATSKIIYLGLADNNIFTANNAQSGGSLYFPGIDKVVLTKNTGGIYKYYDAASTAPTIQVNSNNLDVSIIKIDGDNPTDIRDSQAYGFNLKYIGTGSGAGNTLRLIADNSGGTDVTAMEWSGDGKVGIGTTYNTNYRLYVNGTSYLNGATTIAGNLLPEANNTRNIGSSSVKWANVYATTFTGNLTGNVTGNCSGSSGSCTGNASSATSANITSNKYGIAYYSDTAGTFATTAQGTSGYVLQAGGSTAAPSWIQATSENVASTIVKRDTNGDFKASTISINDLFIYASADSGTTVEMISIYANLNKQFAFAVRVDDTGTGIARLKVGNATASGSKGNASGRIEIHNNSSTMSEITGKYGVLSAVHATNNQTYIEINNFTKGTFVGDLYGNASTASKLLTTPNSNVYFLRGDNVWSNILGGSLYIGQYTANTAQTSEYKVHVQGGAGGIYLFVQGNTDGAVGIGRHTSAGTYSYVMYWDQSNNLTINNSITLPSTAALYGTLGHYSSTSSTDVGGLTWANRSAAASTTVNADDCPTNAWWYILRNRHTNTENNYYTDVAIPFNNDSIYYKIVRNNSIANTSTATNGWIKVLDVMNYTSYTVKKDGTGASGSWGISVTGSSASCTGNAATATKLSNTPNNTTTFLRGDNTWSNDLVGSLNLQGNLTFSNSGTAFRGINYGTMGDNDQWRIGGAATAANAGYMELATADDGNEPIYVRQYTGVFSTLKRTLTLLDSDGNTAIPGRLYKSYGRLELSGTISSRPQGSTSTITQPGGANPVELISYASTGNDFGLVHISNDECYVCNSADSGYAFAVFDTDKTVDFSTAANASFYVKPSWEGAVFKGTVSGTFSGNITGNVTGNCSGSSGSCTGNAATATKLQTARSLWGNSFNGTADISGTLLLPTTAAAAAASQPMAISYGRVQCYGTLCINANTDNSGDEYVLLTAGKGVTSTLTEGVAIGATQNFFYQGPIHIWARSMGNYNEGIRIHQSTGNWSTIMLLGSDNTIDTGTSANSWGIFNNNGKFYICRNGSSSGSSWLECVDNEWHFRTNNTVKFLTTLANAQNIMVGAIGCGADYSQFRLASYRLYVNGNAYISGNLEMNSNSSNIFARIFNAGVDDAIMRADAGLASVNRVGGAWTQVRASAFNVQSSRLVKTNIRTMTVMDAHKILQLRPVNFDFKANFGPPNQAGLIAEETELIMPNVVTVPDNYDESKFDESKGINQPIKNIDYSKIVPYLIALAQFQNNEIEQLKLELKMIKNQIFN